MPAKTAIRLPALIAALCLALAGCGRPGAGPGAASAAAAARAGATLLLGPEDLIELRVSQRASGPVITGSLQPERRADLRAEIAAVVLRVLKENGQAVQRGDLLVQLDDTALRESLASADEAVSAADRAYQQSERQAQRQKALQAQGMISTQALEDAEVRRNNAQSELVAARSRQVAARQQLRRTEVRAPFDGFVSERKVSPGDTAQIGKELLNVIDPRSMRLEGLVSADRIGELRVGQRVSFHVNGYEQGDFAGVVRRIDAAANPTTRQLAVLVDFADPARAPRVAGLYAEGRVETGATEVLMLPEGAIVRVGEAAQVWRLQGRRVQQVAVKLGERDARTGEYPVLAGLAAGDRVLRSPGSALVDGQAVEMPAAAASAAGPAGVAPVAAR